MTFMLGCAFKTSIILAVALVACRFARRRSAAFRHSIISTAIVCSILIPIFSLTIPAISVRIPGLRESKPVAGEPIPSNIVEVQTTAATLPAESVSVPAKRHTAERNNSEKISPTTTNAPQANRQVAGGDASNLRPDSFRSWKVTLPWTLPDIAAVIWLVGATLAFTSLISGFVRLLVMQQRSQSLTGGIWKEWMRHATSQYGLTRPIRIMESWQFVLPMTWGIFRPKLLVPGGAREWSGDRIRVAVFHELAHIQRGDWLLQLLAEVLRAMYWFNPLAWIACSWLIQEGEQACDDVALNHGIKGSEYADHLLALAELVREPSPAYAGALSMAHPSTMERRFASLLNPKADRRTVSRTSLLAGGVVFLFITLSLVVLRVVGAPQVPSRTPAAASASLSILQTIQSTTMTIPPTASSQFTAPSPGPGMVDGIIVNLTTKEPIFDVDVQMTRVAGTTAFPLASPVSDTRGASPGFRGGGPTAPNPAEVFQARTKGDGKFSFTGLKPGTYRLLAARAGGSYLPAEFGQRHPKGAGYNFTLADGQSLRDIHMEMVPTGTISGRVFNGSGAPAGRARVMVLERTYAPEHRGLSIVQAVYTDDHGDYRMFWLPPGQYLVAARPDDDPRRRSLLLFVTPPLIDTTGGSESYSQASITMRGMPNGEVVEETYDLVYYGGDTDPQLAKTLDLRPGMNAGGIDISLTSGKMRARHVRGMVTDGGDGLGLANANIVAIPADPGPSVVMPTTSSRWDGSFDIAGLGSGAYRVRATIAPDNKQLTGVVSIPPGESNLDNVKIVVNSGYGIAGRIIVDRGSLILPAIDLSSIRVNLVLANSATTFAQSLNVDPVTGNFTSTSGVQPGDYRADVSISSNPTAIPQPSLKNIFVKTVRLNGQDVLNGRVLVGAQSLTDLEISLGIANGSISGDVVDARQQPVVNAMVVLVPASALRGRSNFYKTSTTDADGHFQFDAVPPGDYDVYASAYLPSRIWMEASFVRSIQGRGVSTRVGDASNARIRVPLLPEQ